LEEDICQYSDDTCRCMEEWVCASDMPYEDACQLCGICGNGDPSNGPLED
jgi:hypothetical protein